MTHVRVQIALALFGFAVATSLRAALAPEVAFVDSLPSYAPEGKVAGTIRLWGHGSPKHDFVGKLVKAWTDGFAKYQPDVKFENHMYGTASAIGAIYTGAGDLAILGEEISPTATAAFLREKHYMPTGVEIATGSLDVNYFDYAHMIFVHKENPLKGLTLAQLDAIFGAEHRRGPRNFRTWGEVGLKGEWTDRHIQPYGWKIEEDFSFFFRDVVMAGSHRWNEDLKEYAHVIQADGSTYEHGRRILDALAQDPAGIALSNLRFANAQVRALPLAWTDDGPYYEPTKANLISRKYPLTRVIPAFFDHTPGTPVDPKIREFLRYILSREGQRALVTESDYLPISVEANHEQLEKLK